MSTKEEQFWMSQMFLRMKYVGITTCLLEMITAWLDLNIHHQTIFFNRLHIFHAQLSLSQNDGSGDVYTMVSIPLYNPKMWYRCRIHSLITASPFEHDLPNIVLRTSSRKVYLHICRQITWSWLPGEFNHLKNEILLSCSISNKDTFAGCTRFCCLS